MQKDITIKARAKVNLTLDVKAKRDDGYHEVDMIMQSINLCDIVNLTRIPTNKISLYVNLPYLPCDKRNIAYKTALLFMEKSSAHFGLQINIHKNIPVGAGLAGGSTDAAAVLIGLNELFEKPFNIDDLCKMGEEIGSDVPFCIRQGTMRASGRGEILTRLTPLKACHFVLCKPPVNLSTAFVYSKVDIHNITEHPDTNGVIKALSDGDIKAVAHRLFNVLEPISIHEYSEISDIKNTMLTFGALGAVMSGSGPTVFGIFDELDKATSLYKHLKGNYIETFLVE